MVDQKINSLLIDNPNCIFCKLKYSSQKIDLDEDFFMLYDVRPLDKIHLLIIPKTHVVSYFNETNSLRQINPFYETTTVSTQEELFLNEHKKYLRSKILEHAQDQIQKHNIKSAQVKINYYPPYAQVPHAHLHVVGRS